MEGKTKEKKGFIVSALDSIERVGNALPDPATLFVIFTFITIIGSYFLARAGVSVSYEGFNEETGRIEEMTVNAINLLSRESIQHMVTTIVTNFTGFFALGAVFTIIVGVGVAEGTGFMATILKRVAAVTPRRAVTAMVVFLGIMSNMASSTGYVVLVPLGAILFMAFKRHPIAGLAAAFAGEYIINGHRIPDEAIEKYEGLIQYVYSF